MKNIFPFYTVFQVFKVVFIKNVKIKLPDRLCLNVFLLAFALADIIIRTPFNNIRGKKDFHHEFSFFKGFTQTPPTSLTAKIR